MARAQQATSFRSQEITAYLHLNADQWIKRFTPSLLGYEEKRQDRTGLVPGGFLTYIVWQIVPGVQLGDYSGKATAFWKIGHQRAKFDS